MSYYCGIHLHSTNNVVVVIDETVWAARNQLFPDYAGCGRPEGRGIKGLRAAVVGGRGASARQEIMMNPSVRKVVLGCKTSF